MTPQIRRLTSALLFLGVILSACSGGGQPVTTTDLPVFEGATPIEQGENQMADLLVSTMQQAMQEQANSTVNLYRLPEGTTWDTVQQFYDGELADSDWQSQADLAQESDAMSTAGWTRGGGASEQALLIGYLQDPISGDTFLMVGLFSE